LGTEGVLGEKKGGGWGGEVFYAGSRTELSIVKMHKNTKLERRPAEQVLRHKEVAARKRFAGNKTTELRKLGE
jgi:hypothetical protein